ncbi:MAG: DUF881 domain-containing protein [Actinomycetota bacterium]|nr:DUF881 domain-containing protein [Actinomycetota bacterium]
MPDRHALTLASALGILGFLIVTSVLTGQAERQEAAPRKAELAGLINDRQTVVDDLDDAVEVLRRDVAVAQEGASRADSRDRQAAAVQSRLAQQAGTVALRGPGLEVTLAPSDRAAPSAEEAGAYQIHDTDLQLVVNALWAAGAEAVSVNESRLVATTPIRAAGGTIIVNFRPLSPPYVVSAIGADRARFEASEIAGRFKRWTTLFGLGFRVRDRAEVSVPAYTGRVAISAATPSA